MDWITSIDFTILNAIQDFMRCDFWDAVMGAFSYMGEAGIIWILTAVILLFFRKHRATGLMMLAALALGFICGDLALKHLIARPRPFTVHEITLSIAEPHGYSFPSGHATAGFAASITLLLRDRRFGIPAVILAVIICFSRLYNYVHFPSDVLGGMLLGTISAFIVYAVFRKAGWIDRISGEPKKVEA